MEPEESDVPKLKDLEETVVKKEKKKFNYKAGLRGRDANKIMKGSLSLGIFSKKEIKKIINQSSKFITESSKRCYICGKGTDDKIKCIKYCSKCRNSFYCTREHQIQDWKDGHKKHCRKYRYCNEDRKRYLFHDRNNVSIRIYYPEKEIKGDYGDGKGNQCHVNCWKEYFFKLRTSFFSPMLTDVVAMYMAEKKEEKVEKNDAEQEKSTLPVDEYVAEEIPKKRTILKREFSKVKDKKDLWYEFPEFRITTEKISFSLSIYHAFCNIFKIKVKNKVLAVYIPYIGPPNVDLLEEVKELVLLINNCRPKAFGVVFIGDNVPIKKEHDQLGFQGIPACSVTFYKKLYDVQTMTPVDKPDLVVLPAHGTLLHERLLPLFDLLVGGMNVLILFNRKKYFDITFHLLKKVLLVDVLCSERNPFQSYEYFDPSKKLGKDEGFSSRNMYFICCKYDSSGKGKKKQLEVRFKEYLKKAIQSKMSLLEVYIYIIGSKWGFCEPIDGSKENDKFFQE